MGMTTPATAATAPAASTATATAASTAPAVGAAGAPPAAADPLAPPRLLSRPAVPAPPPAPLAGSEQLAQLHRRWAQLHGVPVGAETQDAGPRPTDVGRADSGPPRIPGGVRAKVRARVATAAAGVQQADRAMTGDLVRAVDAVAVRLDELTVRMTELETLVQEVVDTVSEDLIRLRAALESVHRPGPTPGEG